MTDERECRKYLIENTARKGMVSLGEGVLKLVILGLDPRIQAQALSVEFD
jgi:hypothetical protein